MSSQVISYFVFKDKTVFIPFRHLYPECNILIKDSPQLHNLFCLLDNCHRNKGCIEILAKRVYYFFNEIEPLGEMIISYFKVGNSIKAGIFTKEMEEPKLITVNPSGLAKYQKDSVIKNWVISQEFINIGGFYPTSTIIPVQNLIKK